MKLPIGHPGLQARNCLDCGVFKESGEFPIHTHPSCYGGYVSLPRCKECHKEFKRKAHLMRKYGLTGTDYDEMLSKQNNCCALCGAGPDDGTERGRRFVVDHCHVTNKVRGILCYPCNVGMGMFQENPELMLKAISYMSMHTKSEKRKT